jgi:hypothetical protein
MISTNASAVSAPTPGYVIKRCAAGHFSASCSKACVSSAIVGVSRSSKLQQIAPASAGPCGQAECFQLLPSGFSPQPFLVVQALVERHCLQLVHHSRIRACTIRWRCHSSCRRSRFSQLATQICGKSSFSMSFRISCASWRSVFCLRTRFVRIRTASQVFAGLKYWALIPTLLPCPDGSRSEPCRLVNF